MISYELADASFCRQKHNGEEGEVEEEEEEKEHIAVGEEGKVEEEEEEKEHVAVIRNASKGLDKENQIRIR